MTIKIRTESPADQTPLRAVHRHAFGREDEGELVDALRAGGYSRASLVAERGERIVGHILFSDLPIETAEGIVSALALAPLAVLPEFQNQGIGSALIRRGLDFCRDEGRRIVVVLGHPRYYARFGFSSQQASRLDSPFSGKEEFMAAELAPGALEGVTGRVHYPPPFQLDEQRGSDH
jgi:putative acetyltransferase